MSARTTAVLTAVALAFGVAACGGDDDTSSSGGARKTVKVGGIFDLSGPTSDVGTPYAKGIKGYAKYWNKEGEGPRIKLVSQDFKYDVAIAERVYSRLKSEGVVAVEGWGTGDTEALRGKITQDRLPFMSASYAETLTKPDQTPYNFVVATTYSDQMRLAVQHIAETAKGAQIAFFRHDSPFGESPLKAGQDKAKELGLGFKDYAMPAEATDYVPQLKRAESQGAKFVIVQNVSTPASVLAKNIAEQGLDMKMVCLNWCGDEQFIDLAGKASDGAIGVLPFSPASVDADGLAQPRSYLKQTGGSLAKEGLHYAQGWYTMAVLVKAISDAADKGKTDGPSIQKALEDMKSFDTGGVSAPIDFSSDSHAGMKGSKLYQVKDGKWEQLTDLKTVD